MPSLQSRRGSVGGTLFLMLFALPFAGVGVFMTAWLWREVIESRRILATWIVVPAVVEKAELKSGRTSKGGTTYRAVGEFSYAYKGRVYRSERLGLYDGADNVGDYQQDLHRRLKSALNAGRRLDCRVNPAEPSQAVLDAAWRPEMGLFRAAFGILFGGAGFAMLGGGVAGLLADAGAARLRRLNPGEPWRWRREWLEPVLRPRLGSGLVAASATLVWVNLATWPLWSALRGAWAAEGAFKWVLSGALALVVIASAFCLRVIIHARKYRGARLAPGVLPLRPGAPVELRLRLPQSLPLGAVLALRLVSERSVTTGSGKQRRTTKTALWSHEQSENGPLAPGKEIVVRCRLPDDAEPTREESPGNGVAWRLEARADVPGVDLKLDFQLPVFRGTATS